MKISKILFLMLIVVLSIGGCRYSVIVPFEEDGGGDPNNPDTTEVSFAADIEPIFNSGNYCTACHSPAGKQSPNLTTGNAFASLNSTKYLNKATPEESRIYKHPHPDTSTHQQKKYNSPQAAKVLKWIQQGAKNN